MTLSPLRLTSIYAGAVPVIGGLPFGVIKFFIYWHLEGDKNIENQLNMENLASKTSALAQDKLNLQTSYSSDLKWYALLQIIPFIGIYGAIKEHELLEQYFTDINTLRDNNILNQPNSQQLNDQVNGNNEIVQEENINDPIIQNPNQVNPLVQDTLEQQLINLAPDNFDKKERDLILEVLGYCKPEERSALIECAISIIKNSEFYWEIFRELAEGGALHISCFTDPISGVRKLLMLLNNLKQEQRKNLAEILIRVDPKSMFAMKKVVGKLKKSKILQKPDIVLHGVKDLLKIAEPLLNKGDKNHQDILKDIRIICYIADFAPESRATVVAFVSELLQVNSEEYSIEKVLNELAELINTVDSFQPYLEMLPTAYSILEKFYSSKLGHDTSELEGFIAFANLPLEQHQDISLLLTFLQNCRESSFYIPDIPIQKAAEVARTASTLSETEKQDIFLTIEQLIELCAKKSPSSKKIGDIFFELTKIDGTIKREEVVSLAKEQISIWGNNIIRLSDFTHAISAIASIPSNEVEPVFYLAKQIYKGNEFKFVCEIAKSLGQAPRVVRVKIVKMLQDIKFDKDYPTNLPKLIAAIEVLLLQSPLPVDLIKYILEYISPPSLVIPNLPPNNGWVGDDWYDC